ncbi:hypothetical protein SARC_08988 [Sphaeroforma arctica JP610]|uniref:SET domain-containing protein n=1 Tax=Sphaeroforma arctica JP610 TaxID=667725 RepID=A0A0L0FPF9_9EUKA|nr:hypothetical protein SARC_08988 [Sphaeroforma arctica JP610]KNC78589.1 hypothetical protein SARC_08988 [Sphaeroforma arctica JP610]|eukprot:XP_014152491.1 hypothetical protein SARC_08988 [Sphaeroforma arctica JP610]
MHAHPNEYPKSRPHNATMAAAHKVSSLLDWCESLDGQVPARVAFKAIAQQGVGGVAQQAIASTDVVLEIPVDCVITANTARSDKEVGLAIRAVDRVLRNKQIKARTRREADKKTKILSLTCGYRIAKGEQVCIDYGPKGNGDLLLHFGFALENNIADIYTLYYTHKGTGPSASNDTPAKVSKFRLFRGDVLPLELLNAARITVADERERETLRKRKRGVEVDFALIDSVYGTEAREFIQQNDWGHAYNSLSDSRPTDDEVAESVTTTDTWDVYDVGEIISQANEEKALLHIQALLKTEHARLPTRRPIGRSINIPNAYSYDTMEDPRTVDTETHHMDAREASVSWEDAAYCTSVYIEGLHCILDDVQRNVQRLMTHLRSD